MKTVMSCPIITLPLFSYVFAFIFTVTAIAATGSE